MNLPAVTPAQIVAVVGQILAVAIAFGVSLTPDQQKALLALSASVGAVLLWADMQLRKHRAQNAQAIAAAQAAMPKKSGHTKG